MVNVARVQVVVYCFLNVIARQNYKSEWYSTARITLAAKTIFLEERKYASIMFGII